MYHYVEDKDFLKQMKDVYDIVFVGNTSIDKKKARV